MWPFKKKRRGLFSASLGRNERLDGGEPWIYRMYDLIIEVEELRIVGQFSELKVIKISGGPVSPIRRELQEKYRLKPTNEIQWLE